MRVEGDGHTVATPKDVRQDYQLDYPSPFQFEPGAKPQDSGVWERQHY